MAKKKKDNTQLDAFSIQERLSTAPCVPALRQTVAEWRSKGYKGITEVTRELFNYWFFTDHLLPDGNTFKYHLAQREAIETLVYAYEVAKVRSRKELIEKFATTNKDLRLPPFDDFARYCIKMATGSGKTKVMALAIVWQYANAVRTSEAEYAKNFLILAPNVIVFERLKTDFESGRIFKTDPLIPTHFKFWWDMDFYMRGDSERANSDGALYLTNIQQFYERGNKKDEEVDIMSAMLGDVPPANKSEISDFDERIKKREGLTMVLNDEAHHTHEEDNEWNNFIRNLNKQKPLTAQLDFSATPRFSGSGTLFPWTVFDYPLKQAILDRIVKRPIKGISQNIIEAKSPLASKKYEAYLIAGVERWKEYNKQLSELGKKPILFVMMSDTTEADDVGDFLQRKYPELFGGDKLLVIHTNRSGEITSKDLDKARDLARNVDKNESKVNAIVSVLMLREGWDVQNVTVVVGLRPYSAKANILPEQTIGRGLRLMFRHLSDSYQERVDIIGNKAFIQFVEDLEKLEDLKFETFEIGKDKLKIITIHPVEEKLKHDIGIPDLTPILVRKKSLSDEIGKIDVAKFKVNPLPLKESEQKDVKTFIYEGRDILTNEKLLEREYSIPEVQTAEEVIGFYARKIAHNIKLPSQFKDLAPKVREFFELKAFGKKTDLNTPEIIKAMSSNIASYVVVKEFEKILREIIVEEKIPTLVTEARMLSITPPFPYSKVKCMIESGKTIFNYVANHNDFERSFSKFLHDSTDVTSFSKLPEQFGFCIQYTDTLANIRNYFPDFIAVTSDKRHWVIETKGREDVDVQMKDNAAIMWCENATELTGTSWNYIKVPQKEFEGLRPDDFQELLSGL
ncbi:MAG TPA: DEAD/DEAH box helicase family protein [Flavisolibacter sp.]|nr:DEAD/DEAH box helicase family protein [Flavisolibacter sp.]